MKKVKAFFRALRIKKIRLQNLELQGTVDDFEIQDFDHRPIFRFGNRENA